MEERSICPVIGEAGHAVDDDDQSETHDGADAGGFGRCGDAAIEHEENAGDDQEEGGDAGKDLEFFTQAEAAGRRLRSHLL